MMIKSVSPSGLVAKNIAVGVGGLGFDSRYGEIGHLSPTARYRCDVSSELCWSDAKPRI